MFFNLLSVVFRKWDMCGHSDMVGGKRQRWNEGMLHLQVKINEMKVMLFASAPEGRPGMSDVSPLSGISGLSFDSTLLSPVLFFCLVLFLFLTYFLSTCWSILLNFFQKILPRFFVKTKAFLYGPCSAARGSKLVGGMYNMLPYGTCICC